MTANVRCGRVHLEYLEHVPQWVVVRAVQQQR